MPAKVVKTIAVPIRPGTKKSAYGWPSTVECRPSGAEREQADGQHEGEERGLAVAPEESLLPGDLAHGEARRSRRDLLGVGRELEVDVLEARAAHLEALELDALLERPAASARAAPRSAASDVPTTPSAVAVSDEARKLGQRDAVGQPEAELGAP